MEIYRTEEEQVEYIKRWFRANGASVITGLALAIAVTIGWQSWQQNAQTKTENASLLFSQLQDAARTALTAPAAGKEGESPQRATFEHLAKQLKGEYAGTTYSVLTALLLARDAIEQGDAAKAETELRWALAQKPQEGMRLVITLRLARVLAMKGDTDGALALIDAASPGAQKGNFEEVRGDILLARSDKAGARKAYQAALDALDAKAPNRGLLQVKLDDLAVAQ